MLTRLRAQGWLFPASRTSRDALLDYGSDGGVGTFATACQSASANRSHLVLASEQERATSLCTALLLTGTEGSKKNFQKSITGGK